MQAQLLEALGASGDESAVPAILALAQSGSSSVRMTAVEALGTLGGDAAVNALTALLASGRRDALGVTTRALAQSHSAAGERVLLDAVAGPRREAAEAALSALSTLDGPEVRDAMQTALGASDRSNAALAAQWFGEHHDESAVPRLRELAATGAAQITDTAVSALAEIGGDSARDAIVDLASHPGPAQSSALSQMAAVTGDPAAARALSVQLAQAAGGNTGQAAVNLLASDTSPEARDALLATARAGGVNAQTALEALAKRGGRGVAGGRGRSAGLAPAPWRHAFTRSKRSASPAIRAPWPRSSPPSSRATPPPSAPC